MHKLTRLGLGGLKVLVTRPAQQAKQLSKAILAAGGQPVELPMLDIRILPEDQSIKNKLLNLDHYDIIITVSANAAKAGLDLIDNYWPQLPAHTTWLAVGTASGKLLAAYGIDIKLPQQGANSECLLRMPALQNVQGLRILIMKGQGGRPLLAQTLTAGGAHVDEMDLYRRDKPNYSDNKLNSLLDHQCPEMVMVTSINSLDNLEAIVSPHLPSLKDLPLIVASDRIAAHAQLLGFKQIISADDASDGAMLKAIKHLA